MRRPSPNIVSSINNRMKIWHARQSSTKAPLGSLCLWWAKATVLVLQDAGLNAQIQAGTAFWRIVDEKDDDGIINTHFGYQFESKAENIVRLNSGMMPEMHCWAGILPPSVEAPILVDFTTEYWPERCDTILHQKWTAKHPPEYLWTTLQDMPDGCRYVPCMEATRLAYLMMKIHPQNV